MIVGGAPISDPARIRELLHKNDYYIFCDCGLAHERELGVSPDLVVGDFDSYERPDTDAEVIVLPREKDDTDTVYAAKEALKRGFQEFLLIGMVGERFDHSLGNIGLLLWLDSYHKKAVLADDFSEMEIVSEKPCEISEVYPYFSLIAVDGAASGITITGAKYEVSDASFQAENACLGVSNEVKRGHTACVTVKQGRLLLVRVCTS